MKLINLIFSLTNLLFFQNSSGQVSQATPKKVVSKQTMSSSADSLKMALADAKNSFNTLFKEHKDTTTIMISDIDYEDSNLTVLKDDLKKLKGVRTVSMQYKSDVVWIKIPYKGKPTELWDHLPTAAKLPFKLVEAGDNNITLKFKNDKK
jgi:hypothetical protein